MLRRAILPPLCLVVTAAPLVLGACSAGERATSAMSDRNGAATASSAAMSSSTLVRDPTDRDDDRPDSRDDPDNDRRLTFGSAASAADTGAIAGLIRRYYTLAAQRRARMACSLVASPLLESRFEHGSAEYDGSPALTCIRVAKKLFGERHREIVEDLAAIDLMQVRVRERRGLVLAWLAGVRERLIPVRREEGGWRMETLLDVGSP